MDCASVSVSYIAGSYAPIAHTRSIRCCSIHMGSGLGWDSPVLRWGVIACGVMGVCLMLTTHNRHEEGKKHQFRIPCMICGGRVSGKYPGQVRAISKHAVVKTFTKAK